MLSGILMPLKRTIITDSDHGHFFRNVDEKRCCQGLGYVSPKATCNKV